MLEHAIFPCSSIQYSLYSHTQAWLRLPPQTRSPIAIKKDTDSEKMVDLCDNTIKMLSKWKIQNTSAILMLAKHAFEIYWMTIHILAGF